MNLDVRGSRRGAALCAGVIAALCGHATAQVDRIWADAVSGNFTDGGRWSPAGTPQPDDNVTIDAEGDAYTVTLDATSTVHNFLLGWSDATFNLGINSLGVSAELRLTAGTFGGVSNTAGSTLVGSAVGANSTMRDFNLFGSQGDVTLTDMTLINIASFSVGDNGTLTLEGNNLIQNVPSLMATGGGMLRGGGTTTICDSCVDFGGTSKAVGMDGDGTNIAMEGNSELNVGEGVTFTISSPGANFITGDPKSGSSSFTNEGTIVQDSLTGRHGRGAFGTIVSGLTFINKGTVDAMSGPITFESDTGVVNDAILQGGTWIVRELGEISTGGQQVTTLGNGSRVSLRGANSVWHDLDALRTIDQGSRLGISEGRNFSQFGSVFTNFGELSIGQGSMFNINEFGLSNLSNSVLTGGTYEVAGKLMLPSEDAVQFLEANVRLIGPDSEFQAINPLEAVGSQGSFGVEQGRVFQTADDFRVFQGGKVFVGQGSMLDVNGQLVNFSNGVFDEGFFEVAGTLRAPGITIQTISNELILDGVGSQFIDENGADALAVLNYIAPDGILRLRNGRTLDNLEQLVVDGILEIDPGSGESAGGAQLSTVADFVLNPGSQLTMVMRGTGPGEGPMIEVGGDALLGGGSSMGGVLDLVVGTPYTPKLGDEFLLIRAASVLGDFEGMQGLDLGNGLAFEVIMTSTTVSVRVVPTPGALSVLAIGGVMATRRRRR